MGHTLMFVHCWDDRPLVVRPYAKPILSVCLSFDTLVLCDHTFRPIETILVSLESPKIVVSEKLSLVQIGHPFNSPKFEVSAHSRHDEKTPLKLCDLAIIEGGCELGRPTDSFAGIHCIVYAHPANNKNDSKN